jgi:hypothetical protein
MSDAEVRGRFRIVARTGIGRLVLDDLETDPLFVWRKAGGMHAEGLSVIVYELSNGGVGYEHAPDLESWRSGDPAGAVADQ